MSTRTDYDAPSVPDRSNLVPETTDASMLHRLVGYKGPGSPAPSLVRVYAASVAVTYVPLLIGAALSGTLSAPSASANLPVDTLYFLRDWNIAFTFLVSFPMLVVLLITDERVLATSLKRVQADGVLRFREAAFEKAVAWKAKFRKINICAQIGGVVLGIALSFVTLQFYVNSGGFWIASDDHHIRAVGYVYLYCITLLYALIVIYVVRCIYVSLLLWDLVAPATIRMLPLHPDKCGGLRPVAQLGLRNQYTVSILGVNVVLLAAVSWTHPAWHELIAIATLAYLVLGPIVFIGPLLPFRSGMLRTKAEWMSEVAQRLRVEFERLRLQIRSGEITEADESLIDRLRKIGSVIDELPVWPFDARTLRKFAGAYGVPLLAAALPDLVVWLSALATGWVGHSM